MTANISPAKMPSTNAVALAAGAAAGAAAVYAAYKFGCFGARKQQAPRQPTNFFGKQFLTQHVRDIIAFYEPRVVDPAGGYFQSFYTDGTPFNPGFRQIVSSTRITINFLLAGKLLGWPELIKIGKHGLARRDLIAPVNFFSKVAVDDEGRFAFAPQHAPAGALVELRFDMDTLIAISTAPHPLDPRPDYAPGKVGLAAWKSGPAAPDDFNRAFRPECARALHNADMLYL